MIDEWLEEKIDRLCDWAPAYFGPRMMRFRGSRFGWRLTLYASAIKRRLWGALTSIKWIDDEIIEEEEPNVIEASDPELDRLNPQMRREIESWNDDLKNWSESQKKNREKHRSIRERFAIWWAGRQERAAQHEARWAQREAAAEERAQKHMVRLFPLMRAIEGSRFAFMLLCVALCTLGVCAVGSKSMAYMAAACCVMWLSAAMDNSYLPIAAGVRQRYLASMALRTSGFLFLLPMYFRGYMQGVVQSNVILQSTMLVMLFAHMLMTLALVAFNKRQPLFLRALSSVLGTIPALTAASAAAMAITRIAAPVPEAAAAITGAIGAMMAFCADRTSTLYDLGGIRLRYTPVWNSLFMEIGFLLMILGAWIAG